MLDDPTPPLRVTDAEGAAAADRDFRRVHAREIAVAVRNALKLGASLALTWSVALVVKLQIPAHLGPTNQGHYAFAEAFAGMFFTVVGLGIDTYVVKEVSVRNEHASDFMGGVFAVRSLISLVLLAAMAMTLWLTGREASVQAAVLVFGITNLLTSINGTLATLLQATTHVGRLAVANVLAKVVWGAGLLGALHLKAPLYALALPMLASEVVRSAFLVPAARISAKLQYRIDVAAVRSVVITSLPYFLASAAASFGLPLAMSTLEFIRRDPREVGWFAAAMNFGSLAMMLHPLLAWVVMPMISRVYARSEAEMMSLLRRVIEALFILVTPVITMIAAGSDVFIHFAFGDKYAPAATGLSILSLVFLMFYLSIIICNGLIIAGKSWSVTLVSTSSIPCMALCMVAFVPLGRMIFGTGGECAGAAMAIIANETFVVVAILSRYTSSPFDRRNVVVLVKAVLVATGVLVANHALRRVGPARLVVDGGLYVALALLLRLVRLSDARRAISVLRSRQPDPSAA